MRRPGKPAGRTRRVRQPAQSPAPTQGTVPLPAVPPPATPSNRTTPLIAIPANLLGKSGTTAALCATPNLDDGRLDIGPRELRFYESTGEVLSVRQDSPTAITIVARYAGEGEEWQDERSLILNPAGDRLTADSFTRVRCP